MRSKVFLSVFILLAALVGGLYWFQFIAKPAMIKTMMGSMQRPVAGVAVEAAREETWTPRLSTIGTFKSVPGIDVAGDVAGIVAELAFENGQDVEKGALLARIDDSMEQADLKANTALLKNAQQAYERQQMLMSQGVAARSNFDLALAARDQATGALERTRALIAHKTLTAPFAGRVGIRKVDVGQYVAAGAPIVSLQQLDPIYIDFQAPEQTFGALAVGETVNARIDALGGAAFAGKISQIDARVDRDTRSILVRATFANPDKKLLPGMFANLSVEAGAPRKTVTAPRTAVTYSLYGDAVFVVQPADPQKGFDGPLRAERRFVRTGETREDRVALTEGVAPGEKIVIEGQIKLLPNAPVKIEPGAGMTAPAVRPAQ
jgi:membrane fusion protein (multidrug efflux system)